MLCNFETHEKNCWEMHGSEMHGSAERWRMLIVKSCSRESGSTPGGSTEIGFDEILYRLIDPRSGTLYHTLGLWALP
jgi:hypothetical protein